MGWDVNDPRVRRREWRVDGVLRSISVMHPALPCRLGATGSGGFAGFDTLARVAGGAPVRDYLDAALATWSPPSGIAQALFSDDHSFGLIRDGPLGGLRILTPASDPDPLVQLVAGNRWRDASGVLRPLGGEVGLVLWLQVSGRDLSLVGARASRFDLLCRDDPDNIGTPAHRAALESLAARLSARLALDESPRFTGLRLSAAAAWHAVTGVGLRNGVAFAFEADIEGNPDVGDGLRVVSLRTSSRITHMAEPALFVESPPLDPSGQRAPRPTRSRSRLDPARKPPAAWPATGTNLRGPAVPGPAPQPAFVVTRSAIADRNPAASAVPATATLAGPLELRSDALSEAHAYARGREFFERLDAYGMALSGHVQLPLKLMPRAPLRGAPDGRVVNAEVRALVPAPPPAAIGPMPAIVPTTVEVRFGDAAPQHRQRLKGALGRETAQALGLAADLRWAWHEFGHVLVFAATGLLELPFAHGVGDALAALVAAPLSPDRDDPARAGLTFAWQELGRRHDREASLGWCWCGRRSALRHSAFGNRAQGAGYFEEQLFSSAMMRAYAALGGLEPDAQAGAAERRAAASDYLVYLLMQAVLAQPSASHVPALQVEDLVEAMVSADLTGGPVWTCQATWPPAPAAGGAVRTVTRRRGRVHKVIRWAFEQQGLHPGAGAGDVREGPATPHVDLYLDDLAGRDGHYTALPGGLRWGNPPVADEPWMADDTAIRADAGAIEVSVRNRGDQAAGSVAVTAWFAADDGAGHPAAWQPLQAQGTPPATVGAGGTQTYRFDMPSAPFRWVFVAADCPADLANVGVAAPPPTDGEQLAEAVALDNNLALRRF